MTNDELRALADLQIESATELCLQLTLADGRAYLDYVVNGITAFRSGFYDEE